MAFGYIMLNLLYTEIVLVLATTHHVINTNVRRANDCKGPLPIFKRYSLRLTFA